MRATRETRSLGGHGFDAASGGGPEAFRAHVVNYADDFVILTQLAFLKLAVIRFMARRIAKLSETS